MADVVRQWDRVHRLGNETAHRLAVRVMAAAGELLELVPGCAVFDCAAVLTDADLPRSWAVTSDSIAASVAATGRASRLVLLKSVAVPAGTPWPEAAARGWVDDYFPAMAARLSCPIDVVNFRRWLDENGFAQ